MAPEAVFDFVCDLERIPEYVPFMHRVYERSPGPVGSGTTYKELAKPPGAPFASIESWTCTRFVDRRCHRGFVTTNSEHACGAASPGAYAGGYGGP